MIAVGVGCGLLGAMLTLVAKPEPGPVALAPPSTMVPGEEFVGVVTDNTATSEVQPAQPSRPGSDQFLFVFRAAGNTYLKLAELDDEPDQIPVLPKHDKLKVFDKEDTVAIGVVREADLPDAYGAWIGKQVIVDGSCKANVTGFAVVARLAGDPGYAGIENEKWTANSVMKSGSVVLAGRLDGCAKGTFARDAALAPIIIPTPVENAGLVAEARSAILASSAANDAAVEWAAHKQTGEWYESTNFVTLVVRHPKTGVTWIAIQGRPDSDGCGGPDINVFGLYRVDAQGALIPVEERKSDLYTVQQLLDVDGDGNLEIIGRPWLGMDTYLVHPDGSEIESIKVPFFGCPC
jgi:hypothetical protein